MSTPTRSGERGSSDVLLTLQSVTCSIRTGWADIQLFGQRTDHLSIVVTLFDSLYIQSIFPPAITIQRNVNAVTKPKY